MALVAADANSVPGPSLPAAPEAVQKWLRQEDWEALTKAWQEAEAQAIAWAEGSDSEEARMEELWQEASQASFRPSASMSSLPALSQTSSTTKRRKRPKWDEDFGLLGTDHRKPAPLRRYFDKLPSETPLPKNLRGDVPLHKVNDALGFKCPEHLKGRRIWCETHHQTVSPDNDALHPHLRSYFDRRGLESCYRQRPKIDQHMAKLRPRTPQRPSTREKILRFKSLSEPSLGQSSTSSNEDEPIGCEGRHTGGIHWGGRCQMYNTDAVKVKPQRVNGVVQKIPWVADHHVSVTYDNYQLNPMLRHYFDRDGLESSFRNRGMHYGRKARDQWGKIEPKKRSDSTSSWDSIHSSLLDRLSFSSLTDSGTPGGFPVVRAPGNIPPEPP